MTRDPLLDRVVQTLREPGPPAPWLERQVIARIQASRRPRARRVAWTLVPAALAALAVVWLARRSSPDLTPVRFEIRAPEASRVAVVGDFNDWDRSRTPLVREMTDRWSITLSLGAGLYRYAFLVDGERWAADPERPAPGDHDFGEPVSVLTVQ